MYRYAVKIGLKTKYNEENGIIKKNVRMMSGIALLSSEQAEQGFRVRLKIIGRKFKYLKVESIRPSDGNIAPGLFFRPTDE
jgi:hypothetical protein